MLARTAEISTGSHAIWSGADFLARIIDATRRLATVPTAEAGSGTGTEWDSVLEASGAAEAFRKTAVVADEQHVVEYLVFAEGQSFLDLQLPRMARINARAVRTALTAEMWDAINGAWIELRRYLQARDNSSYFDRVELTRFLDFVKKASLDYDGAAHRTMLRNDAYWFSRLGLYIERADNTARILDVKYNILLPQTETIGGSLDYFQWASILRAVSALTAYHWVYRTSSSPGSSPTC